MESAIFRDTFDLEGEYVLNIVKTKIQAPAISRDTFVIEGE